MDKKTLTVESYNRNADALALKFDSMGPRQIDIIHTFRSAPHIPSVLEIGCGNGRDAQEIVKHSAKYVGIDISEKMVRLAQEKVPGSRFEVHDIETYEFPKNLDVIFAFASLIHVPRESLTSILNRAHEALNHGGVFRISLKHSEKYKEVVTDDEFGYRVYYHYSMRDLDIMRRNNFDLKYVDTPVIKNQKWLEVLLKK